jgi:hypothetical protein
LLVACLPLLVPGSPVLAQYPNVRVSDPGSTNPEEVTISINPTNPLNLAAGANIDYYYYSFDGGWTWEEGRLTSSLGVWGDPSVVFDSDGDLYFGHLSWPPDGEWIDRIVVQKSVDGGVTWSDGVGVGHNPPKQQDKEWLAVDFTDSPWHDNIYMCWTEFDSYGSGDPNDSTRVLFSRSTTAGVTWSDPIRVSDQDGDGEDGDDTFEGAVPAVGPDGEIYVAWAGRELIWFDKSTDGGLTFGHDIIVTAQPGGWVFNIPGIYRCNGLPITACDIGDSPYRGNVYVLWSDQRNGTDDTDVFLITSADGGVTWGEIIRVNDDVGPAQQFFPWITVDPTTGKIWVVFYDRRATVGNETEVWCAMSDDGGDTFVNFRVSATSFTPIASVFFGDYINIAALDDKVYPIWTRMDGTALSVWVAIIDELVDVDPSDPAVAVQDPLAAVPNPWKPGMSIPLELPWAHTVNASVYDIRGRLVHTLIDEETAPGPHSLTWAARDVSDGVYFIRMTADRYRASKKLVIVR